MHNDQALINAAFDAGVVGYVFKARLSMDLVPAVDAVLSGNTFRVRSGVIENNTGKKTRPHLSVTSSGIHDLEEVRDY